jgi:hypothetical protein
MLCQKVGKGSTGQFLKALACVPGNRLNGLPCVVIELDSFARHDGHASRHLALAASIRYFTLLAKHPGCINPRRDLRNAAPRGKMSDQRDQKEHEEDEEQDLGDPSGCSRDPTEAQGTGDQSNEQEH